MAAAMLARNGGVAAAVMTARNNGVAYFWRRAASGYA